jgi:hypothetical protein
MSDRIAVLDRGRIARIDTPRAIYDQPGSRFVAEFIGESSFLDVAVTDGICRAAGAVIQAPKVPAGQRNCVMMLRPERLRILDGSEPEAMNRFEGTVQSAIYQGDTLLLQLVLGDGSLVSLRMATRGDDAAPPARGTPIAVGIAVSDTVLLGDEGRARKCARPGSALPAGPATISMPRRCAATIGASGSGWRRWPRLRSCSSRSRCCCRSAGSSACLSSTMPAHRAWSITGACWPSLPMAGPSARPSRSAC